MERSTKPPSEPFPGRRRLYVGVYMQALEAGLAGSPLTLEAGRSSEAAQDAMQEFEARLRECSHLAFRIALGVLRNPADAEDVAQETFLRAYRNFHHLRDRERFRAWLARIAWRLALDRWRSAVRRERREVAAAEVLPRQSVEQVVASREFQTHLDRAMEELPEKLRQALILAAVEGYKLEEVARLLGVPEGTVKSRVHLARKRLAEKLQWIVRNTPKD